MKDLIPRGTMLGIQRVQSVARVAVSMFSIALDTAMTSSLYGCNAISVTLVALFKLSLAWARALFTCISRRKCWHKVVFANKIPRLGREDGEDDISSCFMQPRPPQDPCLSCCGCHHPPRSTVICHTSHYLIMYLPPRCAHLSRCFLHWSLHSGMLWPSS